MNARSTFLIPTLLAALASLSWAQLVSATDPKPNIILIMVDDLGYADISPYGQRKIQTPHLARLAERGMILTQYYAGVSVCAPSRSSLVEGLHTGHAFIRGNKQNDPVGGQWPLPENTVTIAKVLQAAGYATGMIGKWGLGNPGTTGDPLKQGWDFYFGYTDQVLAHNYYPDHLLKNGKKIPLDNQPVYLPEKFKGLGSYTPDPKEYSHDFLMKESINFIQQHVDRPFFLYLPFTIPHENGEQAKGMRFEVPSQGIYADRPWTKEQKDYAAMISYLDEGIGDIVQATKTAGIDKRTLILFCSDNGPMRGHPVTGFFNSNGDLRGGKRDLYEGGIRSPLIAYWPSVVTAGTVSDHLCAAWDFFPTFCDLAGVAIPEGRDGISILPTLTGKKQPTHAFLYWEFHTNQGMQALRMGDWKAIRFNAGIDAEAPIQLYNLAEDLGETNDIAAEHPAVAMRMAEIMSTEHTPSEVFPFQREQ
jgi:arylsulfatase A